MIIGIVLVFLLTNLNAIVKAAIEKNGSVTTQTALRVEKVRISLKQGSGAIYGLSVANPRGFSTPHAFSLGEISIQIDLRSLTREVKAIDEVIIRGPQVFAEINTEKAINLNELNKNLVASVPAKTNATTDDRIVGKEPRLIIRHIRFSDGTIEKDKYMHYIRLIIA